MPKASRFTWGPFPVRDGPTADRGYQGLGRSGHSRSTKVCWDRKTLVFYRKILRKKLQSARDPGPAGWEEKKGFKEKIQQNPEKDITVHQRDVVSWGGGGLLQPVEKQRKESRGEGKGWESVLLNEDQPRKKEQKGEQQSGVQAFPEKYALRIIGMKSSHNKERES